MLYGPAPAMKLPGNPAAMAFPGESLGAYYHGCSSGRDLFQFVYAQPEFISPGISIETAPAQAAQFPAEKGISQALPAKQIRQVSLSEGGYLALWETAHIDDDIDSVKEENLDKVLFAPGGCAEREKFFRVRSHGHSIS